MDNLSYPPKVELEDGETNLFIFGFGLLNDEGKKILPPLLTRLRYRAGERRGF